MTEAATPAPEVVSAEQARDLYRVGVLSSLNLDRSPDLKGFRSPDGTGIGDSSYDPEHQTYQLSFRVPGKEDEHWRQCNVGEVDPATGNVKIDPRGVLYERCEKDGTLYIGENGPERIAIRIGSRNTPGDLADARGIVAGDRDVLDKVFKEGKSFGEHVAAYISASAETRDGNQGKIIVGAHSMGENSAITTAAAINEQLGRSPDNQVNRVIAAPLGPGQALKEGARFIAESQGAEATPERMQAIMDTIADDTVMTRPKVWTIISELHVGPEGYEGGNDMYGQQLSYSPTNYRSLILGDEDDLFLTSDEFKNLNVLSHNTQAMVNGMLAHGLQDALEPREIFNATHKPKGWTRDQSLAYTDEFNTEVTKAMDLKNIFTMVVQLVEDVVDWLKGTDPEETARRSFEDHEIPEDPSRNVVASIGNNNVLNPAA